MMGNGNVSFLVDKYVCLLNDGFFLGTQILGMEKRNDIFEDHVKYEK